MPTKAQRYKQHVRDCLKLANIVPPGVPRDTLREMALEWARLADEQGRATVQQQQQVQLDDDKKK
jgi:hypothetical protein